jgi:sodium-dependent dicarboxylate transporter 2/3/5
MEAAIFYTLFLGFWMITWWVFEIMPLGITALIPLFFLPFSGIVPLDQVTRSYSNPVIFLFLGGFIIARAMEKTRLDERIALSILARTGTSDRGIVLGFVIATAFLSMWISNTATTVMMVPIALSVVQFLKENLQEKAQDSLTRMRVVLFLSIAYAANIGGVMTPVGTPPNVVFLGYINDLYGRNIDFSVWMFATVPLACAILFVMVQLLHRLFPFAVTLPPGFLKFILDKKKHLGAVNASQSITIWVFLLAASLWVGKGGLHWLIGSKFLNDTSIAIAAGVLLFLFPAADRHWSPILQKEDIKELPWDIVLLFGGGMALASGLKEVGIIEGVTQYFASLQFASNYLLIFALALIALFLTEVMSNVALCVVALPLIMKLGEVQSIDPLLVAMPAALCTSFAFSMPISTPPNAIVFGTDAIQIKHMLKAGLLLNLIAVGLTMTLGYLLIHWIIL